MVTIHLHHVILFAHHGIYDDEKKNGNTFEVNLDVVFERGEESFDSIDHTVSYEDLFGIVKQRMQIATPLLEKVCAEIISAIKRQFPFTKEISISIYKLNAPIEGFNGKAGVTIRKKFDD